jgi:hypothetical protein
MISRVVHRRQPGRRIVTTLAATGLLVGTLVLNGTVLAVHDEGVFQLDGNAITTPANSAENNPGSDITGAHDWSQVYADRSYAGDPPFPTSGAASQAFVTDITGAGDSILTGGSTKDIADLPSWLWKQTAVTSVQDKDDIEHAFAAQYSVDKSSSQCGTAGPQNPCVLLYFGADRFANSGSTTMGFWFYKSRVTAPGPDAAGNGTFTGTHTARSSAGHGDILIVSDFLIGGAAPTVSVYEWVDSGGSASTHLDLIGGGTATLASCTAAPPVKKNGPSVPPVSANDNLCATTNQNVITSPWPFTAKTGQTGQQVSEFMEGGINMTALGLGNECFNSFLAETRSSPSPTSTLSDFALGNFGSCGASLATKSSKSTLAIGDAAPTDAATITVNSSGANPPAPTGTVSFYLCGPSDTAITSCAASGTAFDTKPLSGAVVSGKTYKVTSAAPSITSAGYYCFTATWPGDTHYTDGPYEDNGTDECFSVTPLTPTIVTTTSDAGPVVPGTAVSDDAVLSGTATPSNAAQGTITFNAYGPDDATCATSVYTSVVNLVSPGDGTYNSADGDGGVFAPTDPGTYRWTAAYAPATGDKNNVATSEDCNGTGESFVVQQFQPALTTAQTVTIKDSATITVSGGGNLTGTAHFQPFSDSSCTAGNELAAQDDVSVSGASGTTVDSSTMTITTTADHIYWQVSYSSSNGAQKDIAATCTENSSITITN